MGQKTCKERVKGEYIDTINTIRKLWELHKQGSDACNEDGSNWMEYGLSFDYVPKGTFPNQRRSYFRFQISWGGPSEEFRFFCDENLDLVSVEYWFLDWFDGAKVEVTRQADWGLWQEIWDDWKDCDLQRSKMQEVEIII